MQVWRLEKASGDTTWMSKNLQPQGDREVKVRKYPW